MPRKLSLRNSINITKTNEGAIIRFKNIQLKLKKSTLEITTVISHTLYNYPSSMDKQTEEPSPIAEDKLLIGQFYMSTAKAVEYSMNSVFLSDFSQFSLNGFRPTISQYLAHANQRDPDIFRLI